MGKKDSAEDEWYWKLATFLLFIVRFTLSFHSFQHNGLLFDDGTCSNDSSGWGWMRGEDINSDKLRITMEILHFLSTLLAFNSQPSFILTNGEHSWWDTFSFSFNSLGSQVFHARHSCTNSRVHSSFRWCCDRRGANWGRENEKNEKEKECQVETFNGCKTLRRQCSLIVFPATGGSLLDDPLELTKAQWLFSHLSLHSQNDVDDDIWYSNVSPYSSTNVLFALQKSITADRDNRRRFSNNFILIIDNS